jgi:hypothetical protein
MAVATIDWASGVLRRQGMPEVEIDAVLDDRCPEDVRRHLLELHEERLWEWLADDRQLLDAVTRSLATTPYGRRPRC